MRLPAGLALLVVTWWLSIGVVVVGTMPSPAASAPTAGLGLVPGQAAYVNQPGLPKRPIPVDRIAFHELARAYLEADEDAIERRSTATDWVTVVHGQGVRIVEVDGDAVRVEVLDGAESGRSGWLRRRSLLP